MRFFEEKEVGGVWCDFVLLVCLSRDARYEGKEGRPATKSVRVELSRWVESENKNWMLLIFLFLNEMVGKTQRFGRPRFICRASKRKEAIEAQKLNYHDISPI